MAKTIILKLKGLTQFWPPKEARNSKTTCQMPTKRGVLRHIVAAAQGRSPDADISDLEKAIFLGQLSAASERLSTGSIRIIS